jgi:hypothetical protein
MPKQVLMVAKRGELAKAMVELDLNGGTLAKNAGLGVMVVGRARQGHPVRRSAAAAIAGALRKSIDDLFVPADAEKAAA